MTNHVHLVYRTVDGNKPESVLGDFKSVTSRKLVKAIQENPRESRKEFLLHQFKKAAGESPNVKNYQFWRHDNKPIELWSNKVIARKIGYIHQNPVEAGLVYRAEVYIYSSALDYADEKGLLENIFTGRFVYMKFMVWERYGKHVFIGLVIDHTRGRVRERWVAFFFYHLCKVMATNTNQLNLT